MRLLSSLLVGFYLIAALVSALAITNSVDNDVKEFNDRELLSPRGDVSTVGICRLSNVSEPDCIFLVRRDPSAVTSLIGQYQSIPKVICNTHVYAPIDDRSRQPNT
ncbi:hypothetical protein CPB84DRAFT_1794289 [Gymnopilus junonius]|uniref:Uncharacterized protein n=1 Tax=Gymnopilus junonius TaxID=109634 RepID=A0A9P5THI1_GYMJU|nr:hypothetical protein CPB84DRAFT_1794289 [Gymnopilus junonius]